MLDEVKRKKRTNERWEMKRRDVTICEELGHCDFGKVYKGVLKSLLCVTQGPSTEKDEKSTNIVLVKMLRGNVKTEMLFVRWVKFPCDDDVTKSKGLLNRVCR